MPKADIHHWRRRFPAIACRLAATAARMFMEV
jgi:hypothetical protein